MQEDERTHHRRSSTATTNNRNSHHAATSAMSSNNNQKTASCRSCVRLIREILDDSTSRPRQVIDAIVGGMMRQQQQSPQQSLQQQQPSFSLKPVAEGVQVEMRVPNEPYTMPKRWTRIAAVQPEDVTSTHTPPRLTSPVLATSSSLSSPASQLVTSDPVAPSLSATTKSFITETIKIECRPCESTGPEQGARALIMGPNPLSLVMCTNRLDVSNKHEMSQVLVHELLHAYDVKRLQLDFSDCESMAYSEVRAAREAECFSGTTTSSGWPFFMKEYCVKQKAIAATHNLFPAPQGRNCVSTVFQAAYADPRPFSKEEVRQFVQRQQQQSQQQQQQQASPSLSSLKDNRYLYTSATSGSQK